MKNCSNKKKLSNLYKNILDSLSEGILFVNKKTLGIQYMNDCAKQILGYNSILESPLQKLTFDKLLYGQDVELFFNEKKPEVKQSQLKTEEVAYFFKFGGEEKIKIAYKLIKSGSVSGYTIQFKEYEKSEQKLFGLSYYDQLTFLPNRLYAEQFFINVTEKYENEKQIAILFMDLDGFKAINDSKGHKAGDELLKAISQKVQDNIGEKGIVSRFGGDEFIIILDDFNNTNDLLQISNQLLYLISQPLNILGFSIKVSASIGAACYPNDGKEMQTLIKKADEAMYTVKRNGKNAFQFYNENTHISFVNGQLLQNHITA